MGKIDSNGSTHSTARSFEVLEVSENIHDSLLGIADGRTANSGSVYMKPHSHRTHLQADLHTNLHANPLMMLANCVNTPIYVLQCVP